LPLNAGKLVCEDPIIWVFVKLLLTKFCLILKLWILQYLSVFSQRQLEYVTRLGARLGLHSVWGRIFNIFEYTALVKMYLSLHTSLNRAKRIRKSWNQLKPVCKNSIQDKQVEMCSNELLCVWNFISYLSGPISIKSAHKNNGDVTHMFMKSQFDDNVTFLLLTTSI